MADTKQGLIALAGASGFVGSHLRQQLTDDYRFRALTRSPNIVERHGGEANTEWRQCDLYSLPQVTDALCGCDYAFYLVHSMAPSSRLMQGNFEDTDLLLADNFIRAAERAGVKHVIYLSGLLPEQSEATVSPHLRSRREVELVLRSRSVAVTVLRAGVIFGAGGSSFSMIINLVRRLPFMVLPAWASSMTQSIDILNVCQAFRLCLEDASLQGGIYDLGGHEPMTYRDLILKTGDLLGRSVKTVDVPWNCFKLSKHWVALFSGVAPSLVGPLQESLRHNLQARANRLLDALQGSLVSFETSFANAVDANQRPLPNPRSHTQLADKHTIKRARRVRSIQRMPRPMDWTAAMVIDTYGQWLTQRFRGLLRVETQTDGRLRFVIRGLGICLLELTPTPYSKAQDRCAFYISGGRLAKQVDPPGRLEFRIIQPCECVMASIHGYAPTLPWWLYANTQARMHLRVMHAFGRFLASKTK
ncbi:NAD(P)H-binding protein [Coraliomargarita sp. SDUM461004]|uniref:NAD(P)H-binding protein n=1 Tax=Thalassobacterium sedimentorum TaxID=3041258 RepID=A0ABU1AI97_9BACT|nr:NAD(P)H-binding protein [Coraliomargarita sp. SDUM461004]MDQ8194503.1 NAD(P)H-binding protein [Coraliomargarita sp. SDUM461004]